MFQYICHISFKFLAVILNRTAQFEGNYFRKWYVLERYDRHQGQYDHIYDHR